MQGFQGFVYYFIHTNIYLFVRYKIVHSKQLNISVNKLYVMLLYSMYKQILYNINASFIYLHTTF